MSLFFRPVKLDKLFIALTATSLGAILLSNSALASGMAFEARGMGPFQPAGEGGETMQYYAVPEEVLEDPDELRIWADAAVAVARNRKRKKK